MDDKLFEIDRFNFISHMPETAQKPLTLYDFYCMTHLYTSHKTQPMSHIAFTPIYLW